MGCILGSSGRPRPKSNRYRPNSFKVHVSIMETVVIKRIFLTLFDQFVINNPILSDSVSSFRFRYLVS